MFFAEGKCKRCLEWGVFEGVVEWPETGLDEGVGAIKENPGRKWGVLDGFWWERRRSMDEVSEFDFRVVRVGS